MPDPGPSGTDPHDRTFEKAGKPPGLVGATGAAAIFIDIIGRPLTPLSFAGVARRTALRGAFYSAGAAEPYYGGYDPSSEPCGYGSYPPCRD